jgi:hypothetical protein
MSGGELGPHVRRAGGDDRRRAQANRNAAACLEQSYGPLTLLTGLHVVVTASIARFAPVRPSAGALNPPPASATTQRPLPECTASASQVAVTSLSRPEKPLRPATLASVERIAVAVPDWLETVTVPPPWAFA